MLAAAYARLSPAARGNLALAAIPLGLALIARGLDALERVMLERLTELADTEARLAGARAELFARLGPQPDPATSRNATGNEDDGEPVPGHEARPGCCDVWECEHAGGGSWHADAPEPAAAAAP